MTFRTPPPRGPLIIQGRFASGRPVFRTAQPVAGRVAQPSLRGNSLAVPPELTLTARGPGLPLPPQVQRKMEAAFRTSFSDVRVQIGDQAASIGALAFTCGSTIYFAPGHYDPHGPHGQRLLGHELAHVVQQRSGRVRGPAGPGLAIVLDPALEAEADRLGLQAAMSPALSPAPGAKPAAPPAAPPRPAKPVPRAGMVQAKFTVGRTPADRHRIRRILTAIETQIRTGGVSEIGRTLRSDPLFQAINVKAYLGSRVALLNLLMEWARDEENHGTFRNWGQALRAASAELNSRRSRASLTPEEAARRESGLSSLLSGIAPSSSGSLSESGFSSEEAAKLRATLSTFRETASLTTGLFGRDAPLPITRRNLHVEGHSDLPGYTVRYRSYEGTISPKPNAWVLGELDSEYGPLMRALVQAIATETKSRSSPLTDRDVAGLFTRELEGHDAFAAFAPETRRLAHKIVAIIFFAELSRHSLALLMAVATFHAIASSSTPTGLVDAFNTSSRHMRPLFAGTGGANLLRGESSGLSTAEVARRELRAVVDLQNYIRSVSESGEPQTDFIKRKTLEIILGLTRHTGETPLTLSGLGPALLRLIHRIQRGTGNSLTLLTTLGFTRHAQLGDENDCAIYTIFDQLNRVHGMGLTDFAGFRDHVRTRAAFAFGSMIDVLNNGQALLQAVQHYLVNVLHRPAEGLAIDVWAATAEGGLMEFQNVARAAGPSTRVLTFYYNGINHFDSLTGGLART